MKLSHSTREKSSTAFSKASQHTKAAGDEFTTNEVTDSDWLLVESFQSSRNSSEKGTIQSVVNEIQSNLLPAVMLR